MYNVNSLTAHYGIENSTVVQWHVVLHAAANKILKWFRVKYLVAVGKFKRMYILATHASKSVRWLAWLVEDVMAVILMSQKLFSLLSTESYALSKMRGDAALGKLLYIKGWGYILGDTYSNTSKSMRRWDMDVLSTPLESACLGLFIYGIFDRQSLIFLTPPKLSDFLTSNYDRQTQICEAHVM